MLVSRESYITKVKLKPLNKKKYSQRLIDRAYSLYLMDFHQHDFGGQYFTIHGFERHAFNRDLFIQIAIKEQRDKKIKELLDGLR